VLLQDRAAPRVELDLAHDGHARTLEAEVEAADAGEQGQDFHGRPRYLSASRASM
jgi:hypothetical protein